MDFGPLIPEDAGALAGGLVIYAVLMAVVIVLVFFFIRAAVRSGVLAALRQHQSEQRPDP